MRCRDGRVVLQSTARDQLDCRTTLLEGVRVRRGMYLLDY